MDDVIIDSVYFFVMDDQFFKIDDGRSGKETEFLILITTSRDWLIDWLIN